MSIRGESHCSCWMEARPPVVCPDRAMYPNIQYFASKSKTGGDAGGISNSFIDSPPSFSGKIRLVPRVISRI